MSHPSAVGVVALIDAAIADAELGPDAVRYNAPPGPFAENSRPWLRFGDGSELPITGQQANIVWANPAILAATVNVGRYVEAFALQMRQASETVIPSITEAMQYAHRTFAQLVAAFGVPPCVVGGAPCSCHPRPFPAARDYRRRTKHRNRRRRT